VKPRLNSTLYVAESVGRITEARPLQGLLEEIDFAWGV
jgi:hypothetical protein